MSFSNLTKSAFRPTLPNTSGPATSPGPSRKRRHQLLLLGRRRGKIARYRGKRLALRAGRRHPVGARPRRRRVGPWARWTAEQFLPLPLLFSLCMLPFTLISPVRSLSLSLRLIPNESSDALRTIRQVVPPEPPEPADPCLRSFLGDGVGVLCGSCSDETSIEGRCMRSNPVLVSLYCTRVRSSTCRMSALRTAGCLVDVVATL